MTPAGTALLTLLIVNTLLGALCLAVGRGERRSRALWLWGWGLLFYSGGILLTIASILPIAASKVLGNALIAYAPIPAVDGAVSYTTFRLDHRWTTAAFLLTVGLIVLNHLRHPYSVLIDILAPSPLANVLFLIAAIALIRKPPAKARIAARFVASVFVFAILVWSARMWAIWASIGGTNERARAGLPIALFGIAQVVIAVAATLGLLWIEFRNMEAALRRLAATDPLTDLPNRRASLVRFNETLRRSARYERRFAILLLDLDHFKRINDTWGHLAGDQVLRHVGRILRSSGREAELAGRLGGEEFMVLLDEQDIEGAIAAANRLHNELTASPIDIYGDSVAITASGGLAVYPDDGENWDQLMTVADRRLYRAKTGGRNRVEPAPPVSRAASPVQR